MGKINFENDSISSDSPINILEFTVDTSGIQLFTSNCKISEEKIATYNITNCGVTDCTTVNCSQVDCTTVNCTTINCNTVECTTVKEQYVQCENDWVCANDN